MKKARLKELREIIKRNPAVLDSLHPTERLVVMRLCKGIGHPGEE